MTAADFAARCATARTNGLVDVTFIFTGFQNANAVMRLWVSTHSGTWYDSASCFSIGNYNIDPAVRAHSQSEIQRLFADSTSSFLSAACVCAQTLTANVTLLDVPSATSGFLGAFALHDADQDGQPGRNWIGYPTEAVTATRGARGGPFGGPWWEDARVAIDASVAPCVSFEMAMWYP